MLRPPLLVGALALVSTLLAATPPAPLASADLVFAETDGLLALEAEHFHRQSATETRAWWITAPGAEPALSPDPDPAHLADASAGAYVEILPDTRATHADKLVSGQNFTESPGKLAVLHYRVRFATAGRYHVWLRAHSTGTEDNGVHVGLNNEWPESGRRWQTTAKNKWHWDCRQRTPENHSGQPLQLFLDVPSAGDHELLVSMREDGFELDKIVLAKDPAYRPVGHGPAPLVAGGEAPPPFAPASPVSMTASATTPAATPSVTLVGEPRQWHALALDLVGPFARETDTAPNPFLDLRFEVTFVHESGEARYRVPGFFAADGRAAESGAEEGRVWRARFSPDRPGRWSYEIAFHHGPACAIDASAGRPLAPFHGLEGRFDVGPSDKSPPDLRARGRLSYVGGHHLRFAGTGEYFLKAGADSPETFLAYADFDQTTARRKIAPLKTWSPHLRDWREEDPTWRDGKGKGIIGALNYLAASGLNSVSFLTYNVGGDGNNVWPFVAPDAKFHYDCSKLDQWEIVFAHAGRLGLHLHFKLQETENDDHRGGRAERHDPTPAALDGGLLGPERKLYLREIVARFGHHLALNWNLGEENTQTPEEVVAMIDHLAVIDPYRHPVVIHSFPDLQEKVYRPLLAPASALTGASLQNDWDKTHRQTLRWVRASREAGRPWVVANDEQGGADTGVPPDTGYDGYAGRLPGGARVHTVDQIRQATLWGNLMAGGAGVEYYFGYRLPQNDLNAEDYRSRAASWRHCRVALDFFREQAVPFWRMRNANALVGNDTDNNERYCLAAPGEIYLVYLPRGGESPLDLGEAPGRYTVAWFNPRDGGPLLPGSPSSIEGGKPVRLPAPDSAADWLALVRKAPDATPAP